MENASKVNTFEKLYFSGASCPSFSFQCFQFFYKTRIIFQTFEFESARGCSRLRNKSLTSCRSAEQPYCLVENMPLMLVDITSPGTIPHGLLLCSKFQIRFIHKYSRFFFLLSKQLFCEASHFTEVFVQPMTMQLHTSGRTGQVMVRGVFPSVWDLGF